MLYYLIEVLSLQESSFGDFPLTEFVIELLNSLHLMEMKQNLGVHEDEWLLYEMRDRQSSHGGGSGI